MASSGRVLGCTLLSLASLLSFEALAQRELRPVDEAATRPDFFTFRAQLIAALARHDANAVLAILHKDVKNDFGGGEGIASFKEKWKLDRPDSRLWEALAGVLALGGTFLDDGTFVAPYTYSRWPEGVDSFDHVVVVASGVRVRASASANAAPIATVSFAILPRDEAKQVGEEWTAVRLPDGKTGFIASLFVRSPVDYRAGFRKVDGRWQLTFFVAGD